MDYWNTATLGTYGPREPEETEHYECEKCGATKHYEEFSLEQDLTCQACYDERYHGAEDHYQDHLSYNGDF